MAPDTEDEQTLIPIIGTVNYAGKAENIKSGELLISKAEQQLDAPDFRDQMLPSSVHSAITSSFALLRKLQDDNRLPDLTIIDRRRRSCHERVTSNGNNFSRLPSPSRCATSSDVEDMELVPLQCEFSPDSLADTSVTNYANNRDDTSKDLVVVRSVTTGRRRTRKTISPDDPAEALTEMSVRGLDLFRYAAIRDGVYHCLECRKMSLYKTFKNKYSFQRHAFLYHEGIKRKVFPCPVCNKEFSRPDKMKNHLRMTHDPHAAKKDFALCGSKFASHPSSELSQLPIHSQLQQFQQSPNESEPEQITDANHWDHSEDDHKRRQQKQDVLKIRSVVNAITLRQLQQIQQQHQEKEQSTIEHHSHIPDLEQRTISNMKLKSTVPQQLIVLNTIGSQ